MSRVKTTSSLVMAGLGAAASVAVLLPVQASAAAPVACHAPAGQHCVAIFNPKGSGIWSVLVNEEGDDGHFASSKNVFCARVPQGGSMYYSWSKFTEGKWIEYAGFNNSNCSGGKFVGHIWSSQTLVGGTRYLYVNTLDSQK